MAQEAHSPAGICLQALLASLNADYISAEFLSKRTMFFTVIPQGVLVTKQLILA